MVILLLGGTSEALEIALSLDRARLPYIMTVATDYGHLEAADRVAGRVLKGPFDSGTFTRLLVDHSVNTVVDASHPFAKNLRSEITRAIASTGIRLLRLERPSEPAVAHPNVTTFASPGELGSWVCSKNFRRILVTTGIRGLQALAGHLNIDNTYIRLLPAVDSISSALELGIKPSHIIAMEGPFTRQLNEALLKQFDIDLVITKESGEAGGYAAKVEAALACGCQVAVIRRPEPAGGNVYRDIPSLLQSLGVKLDRDYGWHLLLLGHGSKLSSANRELELVAADIKRKDHFSGVTPAFLQMAQPTIEEAFASLTNSGVRRVVVMPFFLYEGVHVTKDIPEEIKTIQEKYPNLLIKLTSYIGPDPLMADICIKRIKTALGYCAD